MHFSSKSIGYLCGDFKTSCCNPHMAQNTWGKVDLLLFLSCNLLPLLVALFGFEASNIFFSVTAIEICNCKAKSHGLSLQQQLFGRGIYAYSFHLSCNVFVKFLGFYMTFIEVKFRMSRVGTMPCLPQSPCLSCCATHSILFLM